MIRRDPVILSAGVCIMRVTASELRCLLLRAYRYWDFPKGEVEAHEDPFACAVREVREETGLTDLDFCYGHDFIETSPYGKGKIARYYVAQSARGEVVLGINPALGKPEHHEHRWLTFDAAGTLVVDRLQPVLAWAKALTAQ